MWPAGFEPATPRVSGERSTAELQPRALAEPESNRRPPPYQRGALPPELSAEWARLGSNQQPLVCETSALPLSYSPMPKSGTRIRTSTHTFRAWRPAG